MKTYPHILLLSLFFILSISFPAKSSEIDNLMALRSAPSVGSYHTQYLTSNIYRDQDLAYIYDNIVQLKFNKAIKAIDDYIAYNPNTIRYNPQLHSELLTYSGYCYMNQRNSQKALQVFKKAIALDPQNDAACFFLANEYLQIGKTKEMKNYLHKALKINPNLVVAMRMLGENYKDEGNIKKALVQYKNIVNKLPNSAYYRFQYYKALDMAGDHEEACKQIKMLIKLEPDFKLNILRLGDTYLKQKKYEAAINEYSKLIQDERYKQLGYIGMARVYLAKEKFGKALHFIKVANSFGKGAVGASDTENAIKAKREEKFKDVVKITMIIAMIIIIVSTLVISKKNQKQKQHIKSLLTKFNKESENIYELKELGEFLIKFFMESLPADYALLLLYNRQNNSLTSVCDSNNSQYRDIKLVTGDEVANWLLHDAKVVLPVKTVESTLFTVAFPSLATRLKENKLNYIMTLRDRNSFIGFLVFNSEKKEDYFIKRKAIFDPLSLIAAQSLQTLHLFESSILDELTGLHNKRYFMQTLIAELKKSDRYKQPCSLCTFDIDDFKKLNDTYGHTQGDTILKEIGGTIRDSIRDGIDTGVRAGGEEFHIILPATPADLAFMVADRIRQSIEGHMFTGFDNIGKVTVSVGVSTYPDIAGNETDLIKSADQALYMSKRTGKNKTTIASDEESEKHAKFRSGMILENRFDHLNIKDDESGLYNFSYFSMRMMDEVKRAMRYNTSCTLLILGLLPTVAVVDEDESSISRLAGYVKTQHREGIDTPAKFNDKTIMILSPESSMEEALEIVNRIKNQHIKNGNKPYFVVGAASYPETSDSAFKMMADAEDAIKQAMIKNEFIVTAPKMEHAPQPQPWEFR